jgi:hypothetical protein
MICAMPSCLRNALLKALERTRTRVKPGKHSEESLCCGNEVVDQQLAHAQKDKLDSALTARRLWASGRPRCSAGRTESTR